MVFAYADNVVTRILAFDSGLQERFHGLLIKVGWVLAFPIQMEDFLF